MMQECEKRIFTYTELTASDGIGRLEVGMGASMQSIYVSELLTTPWSCDRMLHLNSSKSRSTRALAP